MRKRPKNWQGRGGRSFSPPESPAEPEDLLAELLKIGSRQDGPSFRVVVGWHREVEQSAVAAIGAAAYLAADRFRKNGIAVRDVMVLVVPDERRAAFVGDRDAWPEESLPYKAAVRHRADKVVCLTSGTAGLGLRLLEAVVTHEFAHIVLGHCRAFGAYAWRFGAGYLHQELAADGLVVRLGCGRELLEALRRLEHDRRTLEGMVRICGLALRLLLWWVRRVLVQGGPGRGKAGERAS